MTRIASVDLLVGAAQRAGREESFGIGASIRISEITKTINTGAARRTWRPVPTKNPNGQRPEVIRAACQSPFGTIRTASVLPQKTKVCIANGQTARSAFSRERLPAHFDQAALRG
jgi:hypothetical protein